MAETTGPVSWWDGASNEIWTDLLAVRSGVTTPASHDWHGSVNVSVAYNSVMGSGPPSLAAHTTS